VKELIGKLKTKQANYLWTMLERNSSRPCSKTPKKGVFNREEADTSADKKTPSISQQMVLDLVAFGYARSEVLDCIYSLSETGGDSTKIGVVLQELERRKKEIKKDNNSKEEAVPQEDTSCKICFENTIDAVIIPCGHVAICIACTEGLKLCPMCRGPVASVVKMFKS